MKKGVYSLLEPEFVLEKFWSEVKSEEKYLGAQGKDEYKNFRNGSVSP